MDDEVPELVDATEPESTKVIPVTILTGFLGSGKTTLLSNILSSSHGKRIAVIENEFSEGLGIEGMIAKSGIDGSNISGFFELNNGCICCTVKNDLVQTLEQLVKHKDRFDYIVIETTGVANPGPVITSFWTDEDLDSSLKIDGVVCVVDCVNILSYLSTIDISNDVKLQICYADRIILNKCDLISDVSEIDKIEQIIHSMNNLAQIQRSSYSNVGPDWVLDINCFSMYDISKLGITAHNDNNIFASVCNTGVYDTTATNIYSSKHCAESLQTFSLQFDGFFDLSLLKRLLDRTLYNNNQPQKDSSPQVYRMKGLIKVSGGDTFHILQSVHDIFDIQPSTYIISNADVNKVIFIGRNIKLEETKDSLSACLVSS